MTGAMYAAISGLKSHMSKLNVIGNNVANVNTFGYKAGRVTFTESIYTTTKSGSNSRGSNSGGINPAQIGYGCGVGTIDLNMSPSNYTPTGMGSDCMLTGEGFFLVGDKTGRYTQASEAKGLNLSRMGNFGFDDDGYFKDGAGNVVYGFAMVQNPDFDPTKAVSEENPETILSTELVPLRLPIAAAEPTVDNGGITPGTPPAADIKNWDVNSAVYPYLTDARTAAGQDGGRSNVNPDEWVLDATGKFATPPTGIKDPTPTMPNKNGTCIQLSSISIDKSGKITGINKDTKETVVVGCIAVANVDNPYGVSHVDGPYYRCGDGAGDIRISALGGILDGKYLGNRTVADATTANTEIPVTDAVGSGGDCEARSGGLEASNADVATEFAEMITTQRGYQANTRIITVTDSMLEELVNMKR